MLEIFLDPKNLGSLVTLTGMEIVLGIDNIVFISILVNKLPKERQENARRLGLILALGMRIALLFAITWVMSLKTELFSLFGKGFSGKDLILLGGGLFLIAKSTHEIYDKLEADHEEKARAGASSLGLILVQIIMLDIVFSLDSVITAVGMAQEIIIMIMATVAAVIVMLVFSGKISDFINRHPSMKLLALSFLMLIGVLLVADGMGQHLSKGYVYSAMAFSLFVEMLNMRLRAKQKPVALNSRFEHEQKQEKSAA